MGGLRNPQMAVASSPGLRMVGSKIANILESLYKNEKVAASANSLVDGLGSEANAFLDQCVLQLVRKIFLRKFDAKQGADIGKHSHADVRSSYCDALWERILQEASDPEVSLPIWMREGAAAGEAARAHSKANVEFESAKHVNYRSFYDTVDGEVLSKSEIGRLLQQGFLEQFDSWQQVLDQWPDAVASRVACIAKRRADLTFKLRLTLDLLRSGVNGDCHVPKRVILPRLEDYVSSILDVFEQALAEGYAPQQVYDMTTLGTIDFADAIHTLFAHPSERGKLVFEAFGKWYVYRRIPFGLASAPLLWARLAAACMRVSQALWPSWRLRLQCYVDDPAYVIFGNPRPLLAQLFLFWEVLGCKMAYKKGSLAKAIEWIGVSIAIGHDPTHGLYVKLSIPHAKLEQLKQEICSLLAANLVDCKQLVRAASRMSWLGGILPWMRDFASCLWATVSAQSGGKPPRTTVRKRPAHWLFTKPVKHALRWASLLLEGAL